MTADPHREPAGPGRGYLAEHPLATLALLLSIGLGAVLGLLLIGDDLSATRRVLGGALAGAGSWLLVMVGRAIG